MDEVVQGLTVIFTGDGKGKTSAALGAVIRALGHGFNCKIIQFIKANRATGEILFLEKFAPQVEIEQFGKGFTWLKEHSMEEHKAAAQEGLVVAGRDIASGKYGLVLLDEILYALGKGLVDMQQIESLIHAKPKSMHLILTGRGAPRELIDLADMVTNMEPIKHPMASGIKAQKGLDF